MESKPERKKKIVFHSNFSCSKTGFGRNSREILTYLYKTGKYDIVEYAAGLRWSDPITKRVPWKCFGTLPDSDQEIAYAQNHPQRDALLRHIQYGSHNLDRIIKEEKPDIYIGIEDIWAFNGYWDKRWWNKINSIIHTTLDSLPIYDLAVQAADKVKNYFVWAKFAEEALHKLGHKHVKTLHGAINSDNFYRLNSIQRADLRERSKIDQDAFIIGFVFRNQLRKSVPNLLEGFVQFKKSNPQVKAKLLLHTHWEEHPENSWNINKLRTELGIDEKDVLTTYICRSCGEYEVKPFTGPDADCSFCGCKFNRNPQRPEERTGQITTGINYGITEGQLNEVYNLMNVYVHPFTSGGQEMPVQEAKLTELITLVTNYSCGTEYCTEESGGIPLEWMEYREPGTQFIKATTSASSIARQLTKVLKMPKDKLRATGKIARQFVIDNCSTQSVGKEWENIIDNLPLIDWDFDFNEPKRNENYPNPSISDDKEWLKDIYQNILLMDVKDNDEGLLFWLKEIEKGRPRSGGPAGIYEFFIQEAKRVNQQNNPVDVSTLFDETGRKRVAMVMPQSIGDCFLITSLFPSLKEMYPDHDLYMVTQPQYFGIFEANPYIYKTIPFLPAMESELFWIGQGSHPGYVEVAFLPFITTQKQLNYLRNGKDKIAFNLYK
jgi:glycosyltransferase involved in cell wall biosynthesis